MLQTLSWRCPVSVEAVGFRVPTGSEIARRTGGRSTMAIALASRFWRLGGPKIFHKGATRFMQKVRQALAGLLA